MAANRELSTATETGGWDVVSLLLDGGDIINGSALNTALIAAVDKGNRDIVSLLLDRGADINAYTEYEERTVLITAVERGNQDVVSLLLDRGADINAIAKCTSALGQAAERGNRDVVLLLLDRGADLNETGPTAGYCQTALIAAAKGGSRDILLLLLDRGADVNCTVWAYTTALMAAAGKGNRDAVSLLLDRGADINATRWCGKTALIEAIEGRHQDVVLLLLDRGADINTGSPALAAAARKGNRDAVSLLLDRGADINANYCAHNGWTTLIHAVVCGSQDLILLLLDRGADINAISGKNTALIEAVGRCCGRDLVSLLLDRGADVNLCAIYGDSGRTALIKAIKDSDEDIVSLLLDRGADIHATIGKRNALITAVDTGSQGLVLLLLDRGADINAIAGGRNALIAAAGGGSKGIVSLLLDRGANTSTIPIAFMAAILNCRKDVVLGLLDRGVNINTIVSDDYPTALIALTDIEAKSTWAFNEGGSHYYRFMSLLLDRGADINIVFEGNNYGTALNTALSTAVKRLNDRVMRVVSLLLDRGADVNIVTGDYGTALGIAAYEGNEKYVSLLLDHGADVYHVGGKYETANGDYPTGLDAAHAGAKARGDGETELSSLLALLSGAMRIPSAGRDTMSRRLPPFPMPYTGTYEGAPITPITERHIEGLASLRARHNLTPKQADFSCKTLSMEVLITTLVALLGINKQAAERHQTWIQNDIRYFINQGYDLGLAYAACRVAWKDFNAEASNVAAHRGRWHKKAEEIDAARAKQIYRDAVTDKELIKSPYQVMPRRIWDVKSNRVVEYRMLLAAFLARNPNDASTCTLYPPFWAVTHSWTSTMTSVETSINQYLWPVPLPQGIDLDCDLRKELLGFGAEYVWLDVLCLRQNSRADHVAKNTQISSDDSFLETIRKEEWKLDVPTIGNIYRAATGLVRYFNGLGRPFSNDGWGDSRHWLRRAWTLQEIRSENTTLNGGISHDHTSAHILMNARGTSVDGNLITLRRAIRTVVKLAAEVDSPTGCSVYDLAREMNKRYATQPIDRVAGLLYLLHTTQLPTYDENISDEDAWRQCFHVLPFERKIEILFDYPDRGTRKHWFPTWRQLLEWPQRDPEYVHFRSVWPKDHHRWEFVQSDQAGALSYTLIPNIWVVSDVEVLKTSQLNQYEIKIENRHFGFYCPYLHQIPIETQATSRFALATVSLGHSNNWVVSEMLGRQSRNCKSEDGQEMTVVIEVLRKIGVLATDSCSELFIHAGTSLSPLKMISCVFE